MSAGSTPSAPAATTPAPAATPKISRLEAPATLVSGQSGTAKVTLDMAAPAGGMVVTLSSGDSALTVPASVTVAAGATSVDVTMTTTVIAADRQVTVSASAGGATVSASLRLTASTPYSIELPYAVVGGGQTMTVTVRMSSPAPAGGATFAIGSSDASVSVPAQLVIPAGATSGTFAATTTRTSAEHPVTLTVTLGSNAQQARFSVIPMFLSFVSSSSGDFVGRGQSRRFEEPTNRFVGDLTDNNRQLHIGMSVYPGGFIWNLDLAAPPGQQLGVGSYPNATGEPYTTAEVSLSGDSRGCGQTGVGDFQVLEAQYGPGSPGDTYHSPISGTVLRFHATFNQRCTASAPGLSGEVWVAALPRIGDVTVPFSFPVLGRISGRMH